DAIREFDFDLRRTLILFPYIRCWGIPEIRVRSTRGEALVEVYAFPPSRNNKVYRFATVGSSAQSKDDAKQLACEFLLILPPELGVATVEQAAHYLLDIVAHGLRADVDYRPGYVIPQITVAPTCWSTHAAFLDEPLGEPEELGSFHVGPEHIDLLWVI